jgi:hypothetical protein
VVGSQSEGLYSHGIANAFGSFSVEGRKVNSWYVNFPREKEREKKREKEEKEEGEREKSPRYEYI